MRREHLQWWGALFILLGLFALLTSSLLLPLTIRFIETYLSPDGSISPGGERQLRSFYFLGILFIVGLGAYLRISVDPKARGRLERLLFNDPLYRNRPGQLSPRTVLQLSTFLGLLIILGILVQDPESVLFATLYLEDGVFETLSALVFLLSAALMILAAFWIRKSSRSQPSDGWAFFIYLVLAVGLFFVGMEEISWGQRIIGWDTPEVFAVGNAQDETNLHNFFNQYFPSLYPFTALILAVILLSVGLQNTERWQRFAYLVLPHQSLAGLGILIAIVAIVWNHQEMIEELLAVFALFYSWRLARGLRQPSQQRVQSGSGEPVP